MPHDSRIKVAGSIVTLVFSLSSCGGGGGVTDTALVYSILEHSYIPPNVFVGTLVASAPVGVPSPITIPGVAASAVQALKQNGITVLNHWCTPVSYPNGADLPPGTIVSQFMVSQLLLVASIPATDAAKINHNQNPDPLSAYYVYDPTTKGYMGDIASRNNSFDCASNGW